MESKPWNIYWFSQGQKKEHLNRMQEIQFWETSPDTERIKYNTNGIKTGCLKNIGLLKVKRRLTWIQWRNKIQQHFCWSPINHCYKCTKRKFLQANMRKKIKHLEILGNMCIIIVCYTDCDVIKFEITHNLFNQTFSIHGQKVKAKIKSIFYHF